MTSWAERRIRRQMAAARRRPRGVWVAIGSADRAGDVWPVVSGLWSRFVR